MTQGDLADAVGMTRVAISNIERGYSTPKVDSAAKIFKALDIDVADDTQVELATKAERQRCVNVCFELASNNLKCAEQSKNETMALTYSLLASECSLLGYTIASGVDYEDVQ